MERITLTVTTAIAATAGLIVWVALTRKMKGFRLQTRVGLSLLIVAVACWIGVGLTCFKGKGKPPHPFSDEAQALADAVNNDHPKVIRALLAKGVNPDTVMLDGTTVLHAACGMERTDCVKALLDGGADVGIADAGGRTPLHFVAEFRMPATAQREITDLLLRAGADPNAKNAAGDTPMAVAARSGNSACAKALRDHSSGCVSPK